YDAKIDHLCAVDGGIRVYKTVKLPMNRFDKWGNVNVHSEEYAKPTDEYFYRATGKHYQTGNPAIIRSVTQMIRRADGNLLGESIRYRREGGNFALWIPTSYSCPPIKGLNLETAIFKRDMK
ncbi:MAG: hypothetical protein LBM17_04520, partial [Candidatus Accumulibacter sp.]|nr:hypothetical protein [Accumulibacter sp.]